MCDVEGLLSPLASDRAGDVGVSLAGLASAGEDRALLQSVLDMEAALFSKSVSHEGAAGTDAGGNEAVARGKGGLRESAHDWPVSTSPNTCRSSVESVVGIAAVLASFNTKLEKLQVSRTPLSWCRSELRAVPAQRNIYIHSKKNPNCCSFLQRLKCVDESLEQKQKMLNGGREPRHRSTQACTPRAKAHAQLHPLQWRVIPGPSAREKRESIIPRILGTCSQPRALSTQQHNFQSSRVFRLLLQR